MTPSEQATAPAEQEQSEKTAKVHRLLESITFQLQTDKTAVLPHAQEAYTLALDLNKPALIALSLLMLGLVYQANNNLAVARAHFEQAEKYYMSLPYTEIPDTLMLFARSGSLAGSYDTALEYLDLTLDFCRSYRLRDKEAECLNRCGIVHAQHNNYDLALDSFQQALKISTELNLHKIRTNSLINFGNMYRILGDFAQALDFSTRALLTATELNMPDMILLCLNNIGIIYTELGQHSDALEYLLRSESYLDELLTANPDSYSNTVNNIGNLYEKLENFEKALEYQQRALSIRRSVGDLPGEAASLHNLGVTYLAIGDYTKALEYATASLAIREALDNPVELALSLNCMGNSLDYLGKYDEAISYHLRSVALADKSGDRTNKGYFLLGLGSSYLHKGEHEQALECLNKALTIADELGARTLTIETLREIAYAYRAAGDLTTALECFEKYHDLERDIYKDINSQKMRNLQTLHQVEQTRKEAEIYRLKNVELAAALQELEETNRVLQTVNAERNELMNIVAHDLKNPLSSIMMLADILRNDKTLSQEEVTDFSDNILTSSERMFNLITNLLDVNSLENRLDDLQVSPFDVVPIVQYTAKQFMARAEKKNIVIHEVYEQPAMPVVAEEDALLQVLDNLVSNALKFSPAGKNIWLTVRHAVKDGDDGSPLPVVHVEVRDEGPGMSEDDMAKLFQKFTQLSAQPTAGEHSTGLGLSIVKRLVEAMKGRVWCESTQGEGAAFIIEFPVPAENA